jgi:hypothetical protein
MWDKNNFLYESIQGLMLCTSIAVRRMKACLPVGRVGRVSSAGRS